MIALASSQLRHDQSVTELLIQIFHYSLAEMKEVLCHSGSTSDKFREENCLKGLKIHIAKKKKIWRKYHLSELAEIHEHLLCRFSWKTHA